MQAYMVGVGRLFSDGVPFCLSDHYGLVGLMDVHEGHAGGGSSRGEAGARRMKVSRLRDLACAAEQSYVEEHERDQIRRDKEDQMARAEARILEAQQDMRRAVRQRKMHAWLCGRRYLATRLSSDRRSRRVLSRGRPRQ